MILTCQSYVASLELVIQIVFLVWPLICQAILLYHFQDLLTWMHGKFMRFADREYNRGWLELQQRKEKFIPTRSYYYYYFYSFVSLGNDVMAYLSCSDYAGWVQGERGQQEWPQFRAVLFQVGVQENRVVAPNSIILQALSPSKHLQYLLQTIHFLIKNKVKRVCFFPQDQVKILQRQVSIFCKVFLALCIPK